MVWEGGGHEAPPYPRGRGLYDYAGSEFDADGEWGEKIESVSVMRDGGGLFSPLSSQRALRTFN